MPKSNKIRALYRPRHAESNVREKLRDVSRPAIDFVTNANFLEFAAVIGTSYLVWKNRDAIQRYLREAGIDVPRMLNEKLNLWLAGNSGPRREHSSRAVSAR